MINKIYKINIKSASDNSGVFIGNNFQPNWDTFSKSNTNVSGNHVSDTVNVIFDDDCYDFTIFDDDIAEEVIVVREGHKSRCDRKKDLKQCRKKVTSQYKKNNE